MKFRTSGFMAALSILTLTACNDGRDPMNSAESADKGADTQGVTGTSGSSDRNFQIDGFTAINLKSGDDVDLRQGNEFLIRARGRAADLDNVDLTLKDGFLVIDRKKNDLPDRQKITFELVVPQISELKVTGSGQLESGPLTGDKINLSVTGSGDLKLASLIAKSGNFSVMGSGDLEVEAGQIDSADYSVTGSGDLDADKLSAHSLTIKVSGSGDVEAMASAEAAIQILGSGDVKVKGGAKCTTRKSGSGTASCS